MKVFDNVQFNLPPTILQIKIILLINIIFNSLITNKIIKIIKPTNYKIPGINNSQLTILTQPQIDNTHPDNSNRQFPPSPVSSYSAVRPQLHFKFRNFTNNFLNSHLKVRNFQITNNSEILHFTNKQTFQKFYKVKAQSPSISHLEILNFYKQEKKSKINKVIEKR